MKNDEVSKKEVHNSETEKPKHNLFLLVLFILALIVFGIYFIITYIPSLQ